MFNSKKSDDQVNTEKYRNSIWIKKSTLVSDWIGIDRSSEFSGSDRFRKNGIVASLLSINFNFVNDLYFLSYYYLIKTTQLQFD